jgi:sulfate/thiosulfate transport system ATP-binding protein
MDIRIDKIRKEFGDFPALHDVSLNIRSGELIALLGPSGSGKTTLLRLVAGLEFPTQGRILFGGEDASWKSVQERNVGFVFQHYALFRHMSVADNIAFGLNVRPSRDRPPKAEIRRRVEELIDMVQLSGMEQRYPAQLSGGQRQRVALARAMAIEPRVLLLDEPFGALDAKVRKELRKWLREFHDRTGHTTLFVTHDQEEALELADRVVVMSQGKIEQVGSADDIYDRPQSAFVFSFVGDSASLPVRTADGQVLFKGRPVGIAAPAAGESARLFFRPQDIVLRTEGPALEGRIVSSRRLAGARIAELDLGLGAEARIEIELPLSVASTQGETVRFLPSRWSVF